MRPARWSSVAVAVLFLAGCGQTHAQTHSGTLRLTAKDNNKVFTVKPHTAIVVTLASNRSTGYRWESAPSSHPLNPLRLVSHRYVAPKKGVPGAAGKEIWRFRAVSHGGQDLGFLYVRPWERHKPPAQDIGFSVEVS